MKGLIKKLIDERRVTIFIALCVGIMGIYGYYMLPRQESPDVSVPVAMIITPYPGASPKDVNELVSRKIEDKVSELPGYDYCTSISEDNVSVIIVYFDNNSDEEKAIIEKIKEALGDKVSDVVASSRLVDSPAIVVADENDLSVQMQQMLRQMGQADIPEAKPILEINCEHEIVKKIIDSTDVEFNKTLSDVLLGQAMLAQGMMPKDPVEFTKKLNQLLSK